MTSNIAALKIQSVTDRYFEFFDMILANLTKTLESQDSKSTHAHRRRLFWLCRRSPQVIHPKSGGRLRPKLCHDVYRSLIWMCDLTLQNMCPISMRYLPLRPWCSCNFQRRPPSCLQYRPLPLKKLSRSKCRPTSSPRVQPVEAADLLQSESPMNDMAAPHFDGAESQNSSTSSVHQENGIEDNMVITPGGCSDAVPNPTVTAVMPKRRTLWSRTKKFVRRMLCCGAK